jgi:hypothetical protein
VEYEGEEVVCASHVAAMISITEKSFGISPVRVMLLGGRKDSHATSLAVHRCRFVDYAPSAVTALAFPPLPLPPVNRTKRKTAGKKPLRYGTLAVGHANGNIDLCEWAGSERSVQCSQAWVVRKVSAVRPEGRRGLSVL